MFVGGDQRQEAPGCFFKAAVSAALITALVHSSFHLYLSSLLICSLDGWQKLCHQVFALFVVFFSALWLKCLPIHLPAWGFSLSARFSSLSLSCLSHFFLLLSRVPAAAYYFFFPPANQLFAALMYGLCQTACDCHLPSFCALIYPLSFYSFTYVSSSCARVHMAEDLLAFKQMQSDSAWRGLPSWASEPRALPKSTCFARPSSLLFVVFLPLIYPSPTASCHNQVTPNMCRKVRELVVVRRHVFSGTVLQQPSSSSSSSAFPAHTSEGSGEEACFSYQP